VTLVREGGGEDGGEERRETTVRAEPGESVVEAAARADEHVPFGCLTGACGTCTAELLDGEVRYRRAPRALKARHIEAGYVLACVAVPETDCRLRVGASVQAELVPNPWKSSTHD
jgi:ferredoxin